MRHCNSWYSVVINQQQQMRSYPVSSNNKKSNDSTTGQSICHVSFHSFYVIFHLKYQQFCTSQNVTNDK